MILHSPLCGSQVFTSPISLSLKHAQQGESKLEGHSTGGASVQFRWGSQSAVPLELAVKGLVQQTTATEPNTPNSQNQF